MKDTIMLWLLVLGCAVMFVLCDSLSAHWGKTGNRQSLSIFLALSPLSYGIFAFINKRIDLAIAGALVNTLIVIGATLVGVLLFKEELSIAQYCGVGLALVAVTLLNVG